MLPLRSESCSLGLIPPSRSNVRGVTAGPSCRASASQGARRAVGGCRASVPVLLLGRVATHPVRSKFRSLDSASTPASTSPTGPALSLLRLCDDIRAAARAVQVHPVSERFRSFEHPNVRSDGLWPRARPDQRRVTAAPGHSSARVFRRDHGARRVRHSSRTRKAREQGAADGPIGQAGVRGAFCAAHFFSIGCSRR
jgi:hypothetical protein